jgi:hypothetical protein
MITIPDLQYKVQNVDIGTGYAAGITAAGKSIAGAIGSVMGGTNPQTGEYQPGMLEQNQTATDMLSTLHTMKNPDGTPVISEDTYNSVMGKSLGAKQSMVGLYAGQYIANQAAQRALAAQRGQGAVEVSTAHQKLLDTYQMIKTGGAAGAAATGVNPGETAINPPAPAPNPQPAAQPSNLAPVLGPPGHTVLPAGAVFGQKRDPKTGTVTKGWQLSDGSFMPM